MMFLGALACTPENPKNENINIGENDSGYKPEGEITVKGVVYGGGINTVEGVVISDGLLCVKTDKNGYFELDSDLSRTNFIMASIPAGYTAPVDKNGLPIFYKRVTDEDRDKGLIMTTFEFSPITNSNPDNYTLIVGADPQPRAMSAGYDNIAYHSLDVCEDFYRDMKDKATKVTDRNVYGLMLGDIVHENMALYDNYVAGLSTLGFPMFNVIGNHDNDPNASDDAEGRHVFEEKLGPAYYSFNIGKQHYIVLDNLIMKARASDDSLRDYEHGLTDEIWRWLQNDLAYVDHSTTLIVAAHSPMFMTSSMGDRSQSSSNHRYDYANLLSKYKKVHTWNGHIHSTFNYVYPEGHVLQNIEVHQVARSTGDLWTNQWSAAGTPRGYTVVDVNGDDISWHFKPIIYQTARYVGPDSQPVFEYCDWIYDETGVAKMKSSAQILSEEYQMKVYKPGEYHKNFAEKVEGGDPDDRYIYVNVFLWDDKWEKPKFNGVTMNKVGYKDAYCLMNYEQKYFYYNLSKSVLNGNDSYKPEDEDLHTLFKTYVQNSYGSGIITVTDRFGKEYSQDVTW